MIRKAFPTFQRVEDAPNDTSKGWKVPGFLGQVWFTSDQLEIKWKAGRLHHLNVRAVLWKLQQTQNDCRWKSEGIRSHLVLLHLHHLVALISSPCPATKIKTNQVCLFGNTEVSLRDAMRQTTDDTELKEVGGSKLVRKSLSQFSHGRKSLSKISHWRKPSS